MFWKLPLVVGMMLTPFCWPADTSVRISDCFDGDSCTTEFGEKIRLACIDTPELRTGDNRHAAKLARDHIMSLVWNKDVELKRYSMDRYQRTVAEIFIDDQSINEQMVKSGHAEVFEQYKNDCEWTDEY